jgi:FKBP-type peptidyl-prolyl cis-trans isomerase FklB
MGSIACNAPTSGNKRRDCASRSQQRATRVLRAGIVLLGVVVNVSAQADDTAARQDTVQTRAGYSAGYAFGGQLAELQRQRPEVELESVFQGILDALSGAKPRLSATDMEAALQELERKRTASVSEPGKAPQARVRARSGGYVDDFAALNARREGVVTLPSGVQYEVLQSGSGKQPGSDDAVLVSYQGSLTNGAVFDSTYDDSEPARLQLDEIAVPGLKEALLLMNEGAKWRVVIPPHMGFKTSGNNMLRRRDLIYDIELVSVEATAQPAATPATEANPVAETDTAPGTTPASPAAQKP